jgi:hypothetical protein
MLNNEVKLVIRAMMNTKILTVSFIVSAAILISGVIQNTAFAYPQEKRGYSQHHTMMQPGLYAFGTIASLQNDLSGNPTWIVSGIWKGSLSSNNKTQGAGGENNFLRQRSLDHRTR